MKPVDKISGNITFRHPTPDYVISTPEYTEDAIIITTTYSDGTIAKRYDYKDGRPSSIHVNKPVLIDPETGEAHVAK